jgi:hypothetical protein
MSVLSTVISGSVQAQPPDVTSTRDAAHALHRPWRDEPFPVAFDIAVATHVPVSFGVEGNLTFPWGLLLRAHVGFLPSPYIELVNGIAYNLRAYDENIGRVVERSGSSAFVFRVSGGIRPVPGYGFEVLAGYTMIDGGTEISVLDFERITGYAMNYPGLESARISATLHAFHAEIGWSGLLWDHLVVRFSIGWVHTIDVQGHVEVPSMLRIRAGGRIEEVEDGIRESVRTWGFSPEFRFALGYRF